MNLWLIIPGVVLIVLCFLSVTFQLPETQTGSRTSYIRAVLLVIGLLVGVSWLFEGLSG